MDWFSIQPVFEIGQINQQSGNYIYYILYLKQAKSFLPDFEWPLQHLQILCLSVSIYLYFYNNSGLV